MPKSRVRKPTRVDRPRDPNRKVVVTPADRRREAMLGGAGMAVHVAVAAQVGRRHREVGLNPATESNYAAAVFRWLIDKPIVPAPLPEGTFAGEFDSWDPEFAKRLLGLA